MRIVKRLAWVVLYSGFLVGSASLLAFASLEAFPGLLDHVDLWPIEYYAIKTWYVPHPTLVLTKRRTSFTEEGSFEGDLYSVEYGVDAPRIHYVRTYDENGFRVGQSRPPFDAVVIGDSYIEAGETDSDTLGEHLHALSGRSVSSLGRGFYGPYQYVELLKLFALKEKPEYVLFCFFDGNDIADIAQYQRWRETGSYYFFYDLSTKSWFQRYRAAGADTWGYLRTQFVAYWTRSRPAEGIHPSLGVLRLGGRDVRVRVAYWSRRRSANQLLASDGWQALRTLVREFQRLSLEASITPVLVYIPTKAQIYAEYATAESGDEFLANRELELRFHDDSLEAATRLARMLGIRFIPLTGRFRELAAEGALLYHAFDTHWNSEGRRVAGQVIAESLGWKPGVYAEGNEQRSGGARGTDPVGVRGNHEGVPR